jgi:hypothetical protein
VWVHHGSGANPGPTRAVAPTPPRPTPSSVPTTGAGVPDRAAALEAVDWAAVALPMDCGGLGTVVDAHPVTQHLGGRAAAVVAAHCNAGAGSPPSAVFLLRDAAGAGPARPEVTETLVGLDRDLLVQKVTVGAGAVEVTAYGYSTGDIPRCCPDRHLSLGWRWNGSALVPDSR